MDSGQELSRTNVFPVVLTLPADLLTPLAVYLKLSNRTGRSFLLESVEGGRSLARYSFIGADPDFAIETRGGLTRRAGDGSYHRLDDRFFDYLRRHFREYLAEPDPELPAFIGGAIGYLGFDCCEWFETSLAGGSPEAEMMFFRSIVAFDHAKQVVKIISLVFSDEAVEGRSLEDLKGTARARNESLKAAIQRGDLVIPEDGPAVEHTHVSSNLTQAYFESSVDEIKELIRAGECYQVVLSQRLSRLTNAHPVSIYRALRSLNPSPYMFLLNFGERSVIGASPEMLVRCEDRRLEYRPIAGTRKRGATSDEDEYLASEMRQDSKEVAEHVMLVDLGRNDLGRVSAYGSVSVDKLMAVEKYSHVQHLVSSLSSELREGLDRFDALASCFPAGTVSGAPKVRAIEVIRRLERDARGVYAGAVGYIDYTGNLDTCIAIRTLVLENGVATVQAGAGVVADSQPELEYYESLNKAQVLLKAIELADAPS
jgi:anthranilate synthase component I